MSEYFWKILSECFCNIYNELNADVGKRIKEYKKKYKK